MDQNHHFAAAVRHDGLVVTAGRHSEHVARSEGLRADPAGAGEQHALLVARMIGFRKDPARGHASVQIGQLGRFRW